MKSMLNCAKKSKNEKGITLVALIITVVVMLILAGVAIAAVVSDNGLFSKIQQSASIYENKAQNEAEVITGLYNTITDNMNSSDDWDDVAKVNSPKIDGTGLIPIILNDDGTFQELSIEEAKTTKWYDYADTSADGKRNTSQWANAITKNSKGEVTGFFVWIPRYEYKINYKNEENKSEGGSIDVNFIPTNKTIATEGYIIHPSFTNEKNSNFANGGWDSEISGFWISKFQAGFAGGNNNVTVEDSNITYTGGYENTTNFYSSNTTDYIISDVTKMKCPVFLPKTYIYNFINVGDCYNICREIQNSSYYGLSNLDSHTMKNSEWGAVAYLTHSKYGRNGEEPSINNVNMNYIIPTIRGVTGYAGAEVSSEVNNLTSPELGDDINSLSYAWNTEIGKLASSTGNISGIYDINGGAWQMTAGYIPIQDENKKINNYGGTFANNEDGSVNIESNKYVSVYEGSENLIESSVNKRESYMKEKNTVRKGEAIWETSISGSGIAWNNDVANFVSYEQPFNLVGGFWFRNTTSGIFAFGSAVGGAQPGVSFRVVLI